MAVILELHWANPDKSWPSENVKKNYFLIFFF